MSASVVRDCELGYSVPASAAKKRKTGAKERSLVFGTTASVPCLVGNGIQREVLAKLRALQADKLYVVTDATVDKLYGSYLAPLEADKGGAQVLKHIVPAGDACKSWDVMERLINWAFDTNASKSSVFVAFGGGAVLNVTGLVASMLYRGVKYVQLPTTFLAMHDVTTSLKTSICFKGRKNNIGTYFPPVCSLIDSSFCSTLENKELFSGIGELAKNACLMGDEHAAGFAAAMRGGGGEFSLSNDTLAKLLDLGIKAKMTVLKQDAFEKKTGMIFEYGHTVSHAIEKAYGDGTIPHGIGVVYGMLACSYFSEKLGLMSAADREPHDSLCRLLTKRWPLPAPMPSADLVMEKAMKDSKRGVVKGEKAHEVSSVLLHKIGEPVQSKTMLHAFDNKLLRDWLLQVGFKPRAQ